MSSGSVYLSVYRPIPMSHLDDLFARYAVTMSVPEVAEVLGRPRSTIYKWLGDGTIPGAKVAGSWVIFRDEIKDLIASGRNLPTKDEERPESDGSGMAP
jgi:excisionase family DNA binding protein